MSKSRDIADSAATINYIDNVTSDVQSQLNTLTTAIDNVSVTSGTLTKTFTTGESSTINLTSSVLAPVVSVTKEVPQSGVTNNNWDVNSTTENYTRLNSAYATTLFWDTDLTTASFVDSFSVAAQETVPWEIAFNTNGTKMFVVGLAGQDVNEYTLSTGFDVSTASFVDSFSVAAQETSPTGLAFNTNGTKMFVVGQSGDDVNEYILSTGFDVSTASFVDSFSISAQETAPTGLAFNTDGTKMFVVGESGDDVNEYTLSAGFDVSTASYSQNFSVAAQDIEPMGITFNASGTKMFIVGRVGEDVNEYALSTGFDVSTASFVNNFSVASQVTTPTGIAFNSDQTKMFISGYAGDSVYEYDLDIAGLALGTGSFASADVGKTIEANDGVFVLTAADGSYVETTAPTSYDQVASGSWEMYGVVYNAADGDLELSGVTDPATTFDVSTAVYSQNFSVSAQDTSPQGIAFNTNGTKMFILGYDGQDINEYTLSVGFNVSTASFVNSFSVSAQETQPVGIAFNPDGTKMFIVGLTGVDVNEYTLSTGFDISTASFVDSFSVSAQETAPYGIAFNATGTKMFIVGVVGDDVNEYTLSTGFDVSTASFVDSFNISAQEQVPFGIAFNTNGTKMFIVGGAGDDVNEYTLSTGFDVSTASFVDSFSVAAQDLTPVAIAFNTDGTKMFIVGGTGDDVNEYSIGTPLFPTGYQPVHTTQSIDAQYWTDINSMTANQAAGNGNVYYAISTDDRTTWTVIDNTDGERDIVRNNAGTWQYNSNGTYASETWTNATTNTELAALAEAMEGAVESTNAFDLSAASYDSVSFSVSSQETSPLGVAFSSDGTKMYMCGTASDRTYEYTLSIAWNISTASLSYTFDTSPQSADPASVRFKSDGTKMYILSNNSGNDIVYQYSLSTAWDLSTASYDSISFSAASEESSVRGFDFKTDGTKMYIVGASGDDVNQYALSTAWDVSTASYESKTFSVSSEDTEPVGVTFNSDGTKMYIAGSSTEKVYEYDLSTAWDVTTASYSSVSLDTSSEDNNIQDLAFRPDGHKLYMVSAVADGVYQYSVGTTAYTNQMDKTQLDAVTDPNHIALGNDLDLSIIFNMTSGTTVPSSDGVAINYDANVLNKGAVLGTDYDFDAPAGDAVRVTALTAGNFKVRVV